VFESQEGFLIDLFSNYLRYFAARRVKRNAFEYRFQVTEAKPTVGYSRPILFVVSPAIRDQIRQRLLDILEVSDSLFLNPLSAVYKEGNKIRIYMTLGR
jgi:hypothetical protein